MEQVDKQIETEFKIWKKNIPYLYDVVFTTNLTYQSPSVQWFSDLNNTESMTYQKLLLTTFSRRKEPESLIIAKVGTPTALPSSDSINNAKITFDIVQSIPVPVEINKACYCPQNTNIVACKTEDSEILLYDITKHPSKDSTSPANETFTGHTDGGYAIEWSPTQFGEFVSGGRDGLVCVFDINGGLKQKFDSLHKSIINDVSYSQFNPFVFASCSDDQSIKVTDLRTPTGCTGIDNAHTSSVEGCAFSPHKAELLASSSSDTSVKVWDIRNFQEPLAILNGHSDSAMSVKWSPHYESVLASSSIDRRVIIWDLNRTDKEAGDESEELLFVHGGHTSALADFDWNPCEPIEICSTSEEGMLHVWKIPVEEYV